MVVLSWMHHICMASKYWIPMTQGGYLSLFLLQILLSKETCTEQYHILNHSITSGHTSISNNFPANQLFYQSHLVETARSACRTTKYALSFWWASYGIPKSLPFALCLIFQCLVVCISTLCINIVLNPSLKEQLVGEFYSLVHFLVNKVKVVILNLRSKEILCRIW